jgi:opacity protein-like surface antigen
MTRRLPALAILCFLCGAGPASAQVVGWLTPHVGRLAGGDSSGGGASVGLAVAAFELRGWIGAELDVSHATSFNDEALQDSDLTTLMIGAIAAPHRERWQPYAAVGAGAGWLRGCAVACLSGVRGGLRAGGGLQVRLNDLFAVRGDLRYLHVLDDDDDVVPFAAGTLDVMRLSVGVTISWTQF